MSIKASIVGYFVRTRVFKILTPFGIKQPVGKVHMPIVDFGLYWEDASPQSSGKSERIPVLFYLKPRKEE